MTPEDKQLLLKDLCARLPYWVKVKVRYYYEYEDGTFKKYNEIKYFDAEILDLLISGDRSLDGIKPYLRPISSMTEEESAELSNIISEWYDEELFYLTEEPFLEYALQKINYSINPRLFDWLNKKMFDYRGLIPKGLANSTEELSH